MFSQSGRKSRPEPVKDTIANIRETGEFACSVVSQALKDAMNLSSGTYQPEVDEFELAGLTKAPGKAISAPHVAGAPAVLECKLVKVVDDLPSWHEHAFNIMAIGEVVGVHIDDACLKDGRLDVGTFNPVARLGYMDYTTVTDVWEMNRPD
jgi:flavin reductase (DIM6/NTAB) family NADH-FMN oxidoreductase RutF